MRLLDRYLLRELLIPLGYCLGGFLIFWITSDLFSELEEFQERQMQLGDIALYYLVKAPEFLVVVLPIGLLLALLYTLTNHARHHELTAIRAAGISLWRLCLPYLGVGLAASCGLFAVNELWIPRTEDLAEQIRSRRQHDSNTVDRHLYRNFAFKNARDHRTWQIGAYNIDSFEMERPQVEWTRSDGSRVEIYAAGGGREDGVWVFTNVLELSYAPITGLLTNRFQTDRLAMPEFTETPDQIRSEIRVSGQTARGKIKRAEIPLTDLLDYLRLHPDLSARDAAWLYTQMHGRLAAPWTCLVVVLIAVPFGAPSGRRNVFVGVAGSIFICFAYFILLRLGLALGGGGYMAPWLAAWLPNLTFGATGVWLTARVR